MLVHNNTRKKGGVYSIECSICNLPYFGQTGKSLSTRIYQKSIILAEVK